MTERLLPDLAALTGVRSGKQTYYTAYQRSNERLQRTVTAMDSISGALVHSVEGPRTLLTRVLSAASGHLDASWVVLALAAHTLPSVRPRFLAIDSRGIHDHREELPESAQSAIGVVSKGATPGHAAQDGDCTVWAPMVLDGVVVGALIARPHRDISLDAPDLSVLKILANLAAVSLHAAELFRAGVSQQRRAQQLFDEVSEQAQVLSVRTEELRAAEQRLRVADQRELLESERRRIALELHDSVAQTVLSAGLALQVDQADRARDLMATATEQLRSVIYALNHHRTAEDVASLPELLAAVVAQHHPHLDAKLQVRGHVLPLGTTTEHALARTAGEALFNIAMHSTARQAVVTLTYRRGMVVLRVDDDGNGDPGAMRRRMRLARRGAADGRHRGLVGMAERAEGLGGTFSIRRSRLGGVCIESRIPVVAAYPIAALLGE